METFMKNNKEEQSPNDSSMIKLQPKQKKTCTINDPSVAKDLSPIVIKNDGTEEYYDKRKKNMTIKSYQKIYNSGGKHV